MGTETLRFIIKAKDEASGALRGVGGGFAKLGTRAKAGVAIAVTALVALGTYLLHVADQFEEAFDSIRIATGQTGPALEKLEGDFKAVVRTVPTDFGDAATAINGLYQRLGVTGKPLRTLAGDFLKLHTILGVDLKTSISETTRLFGDWSIKGVAKQREAMNQLFRTTQQTGIGWDELTQTVVQFGAPLRNLGFDFGSSTAMLGKWEKEGVNITTVLSGLRFALKTFAKEGVDPQKGLAKAIDEIGKAKSRAAAMKIGSDVFGLRGASDVVAAIREGRFQYDDLVKSVAKGRDTIGKAERDTRNWHDNLKLLKNNALVALEPVLSKVTDKLREWTGELVKSGKSGALKEFAGKVGDAFGAVKAKVAEVWAQIAPIVMPVIEDIVKTAKVWLPILASLFKSTMKVVVAVVKAVWPYVKTIVLGALQTIAGIMRAVMAVLRGDWSGAWNAIKQVVSGVAKQMQAIVRGLGAALRAILGAAWNALKSLAASAWNGIVNAVKSGANRVVGFVKSIPARILSALGGLGSLLYNAGASLVSGLIRGITDRLSALWNTVTSMASKIKNAVTGALGIHSPSTVFRGYGVNVMEGLRLGIVDGVNPLARQLRDVTAQLQGGVRPALAVAGAPVVSAAGPQAAAAAPAHGDTYILNNPIFGADAEIAIAKLAQKGDVKIARGRRRTLGVGPAAS